MNAPDEPAPPRAAGWWLHPMLVAAFPVVYLFAANVREQLSLDPLNADGSRVTAEQRASRTDDELYLEQLRYANARILALLDRLQDGPPESWPIVVLAADEGPFPPRYAADEAGFPWQEATPEELLRKFSILTAVSVPGVDAAGLEAAGFTDSTTPVNLFRTVFNAAFDAGLPTLPDRNWIFVDQRHLYDLVDVTERVQR